MDAWLRCCTKIFCASHKNVSLVFSLADCDLKNQFSTLENWIYNHEQKSWDTFAFLGRFPIHTGPTPPLAPQTMLDACIQNLFRVSTLCRVGGGRTARSFRRGCSFKRGPRNDRKISIINCSTVTRTFVQDCRSIFSGLLALNHLARFCRSEGDSLCTVSMSLLSIPCEILSIIGLRKKWCFANYLGC